MDDANKPIADKIVFCTFLVTLIALAVLEWRGSISGFQQATLSIAFFVLVAAFLDLQRMRRGRAGPKTGPDVLTYKSLAIVPDEAAKAAYLLSLAAALAETEKDMAGKILADYASANLSFEEAEGELENRVGEIQGRKVMYG